MVPELRPRGIGEILDLAVALYRARFRRLMAVSAAVVVPVQALSTIVLLSAEPDGFEFTVTGTAAPSYDAASQAVQLGASLVVLMVGVVSSAFVTAVSTRVVAGAYVDQPETQAVRLAFRRVRSVVGLSLLVALSQVAGVLACFVGLVVPLALFAVAVPALVLEGTGVFAALSRSVSLTKANFWRVLGLVMTAQLLTVVVNLGLGAAAATVLLRGGAAGLLTSGIANAVAALLTTPFVATAIVACYFDLRIRAEAFDVQLMLQRDAARDTARDAVRGVVSPA
jgi:hypothetical protein